MFQRGVCLLALSLFVQVAFAVDEDIKLQSSLWTSLVYNKIPPNKVEFDAEGIKINVAKSAGPLVYKLAKPILVTGFLVKGTLSGVKKIESSKFDEDSILRLGLVAVGDKTLSAIKRAFAADWVKKLFALAPPNTGIDKIYFFNITDRSPLVGATREHPKSDLILEAISASVDKEGPLTMAVTLAKPIETAALWLSVDGDDTGSTFKVDIAKISLKSN